MNKSIEEIKSDEFKDLNHLKLVYFTKNKIKNITDKILCSKYGNSSIKFVLANNSIEEIKEASIGILSIVGNIQGVFV